jgi:sulfate/thiosulfate transport system permease protein
MIVRFGALGYLGAILVAPVSLIFWRAFEHGPHPFWAAISNATAVHALKLTLEITAISVPLNTGFGILCAVAIVRHRLPGMGFVNALVDLPLALSPVVVGLALYLLYGRGGWFGDLPFRVLFALPAMVLATIFVSLPFVVREVAPVLIELGDEQEQAAATLGASGWQTFWRITLPSIRWGVAYGVVLTTARALGEIGAVLVVSSNVAGSTLTLPLLIYQRDSQIGSDSLTGVYSASTELALLSLLVLLAMTLLGSRRKDSA